MTLRIQRSPSTAWTHTAGTRSSTFDLIDKKNQKPKAKNQPKKDVKPKAKNQPKKNSPRKKKGRKEGSEEESELIDLIPDGEPVEEPAKRPRKIPSPANPEQAETPSQRVPQASVNPALPAPSQRVPQASVNPALPAPSQRVPQASVNPALPAPDPMAARAPMAVASQADFHSIMTGPTWKADLTRLGLPHLIPRIATMRTLLAGLQVAAVHEHPQFPNLSASEMVAGLQALAGFMPRDF